MSLRQSAASRNNSLSQPTHKPGVVHREGAAEQRASPRTRLQQSNRLRGPIENISSPGLTRNSIGYGPNVVHGQSTTMLSAVALPGKRSRVFSTKQGKQVQPNRPIPRGHRSLRDSKKRGSRWQWRLHFEASKHEEYGWLKQIMRSTNLWHLRFNIFIQRHKLKSACGRLSYDTRWFHQLWTEWFLSFYHPHTSRNENYPEGVISYAKLDKVKNFGWKFKRSVRGRFQKNCEFQKWLHETPKGKCWNISHGTVLKICPYKPSAMI